MVEKPEEKTKQGILRKIKKSREGGDDWFREHYLDELEGFGALKNKFKVSELKSEEIDNLPADLKIFTPYVCKNCGYDRKIPRKVFKIGKVPRNAKEARELKDYMKRRYKIYYFKIKRGMAMKTLNAASCPRCESQYIMFDDGLFMKRPNWDK